MTTVLQIPTEFVYSEKFKGIIVVGKYLRGCCKLFIFCDASAIFLILTGPRVWACSVTSVAADRTQ